MKDSTLRIGDLARATGKTVRALRYYEELSLLDPSDHTVGGFRLYRPEDAKRVALIERLQELGFSLDRIREVVAAYRDGGTGENASVRLQHVLNSGLKDIRSRISRLQATEKELQEALNFLETCKSCQDRPGPEHCRECEKGDHRGRLPSLVDALVR